MKERDERWSRGFRRTLWAGLTVGAVTGVGALVFAAVPHSFTTGETLTAESLNAMVEALVPPGTIMAYGGPASVSSDGGVPILPSGWLLCDGSAVSRTTYASLFAAVGINFGGGDGVNSFNLPDLRGRALVGAGKGAGLTMRNLGQTVGEEMHTLSVAETPSHSHSGATASGNAMGYRIVYTTLGASTANNHAVGWTGGTAFTDYNDTNYALSAHTHNFSTNAVGSGQAHNVMQPSAVVNYIIKT